MKTTFPDLTETADGFWYVYHDHELGPARYFFSRAEVARTLRRWRTPYADGHRHYDALHKSKRMFRRGKPRRDAWRWRVCMEMALSKINAMHD